MDYSKQLVSLLIKQYWDKPKAKAEVTLMAQSLAKILDLYISFPQAFDVDKAVGKQLDIIGKIVGVQRVIEELFNIEYLGFKGNPEAKSFYSKFDKTFNGGPFLHKFRPILSDYSMGDEEFRRLIKIKILKNNSSSYLYENDVTDKVPLGEVIARAFEYKAFLVDNQDMTLTIYVSPDFNIPQLKLILRLDLLPKPQGVQYKYIIQAEPLGSFGFSINPLSKGFADKFNPAIRGGIFSRRILNEI